MAKNLQAKLSPDDHVSIFDINRDAMQRLLGETKAPPAGGASVGLASSAADASKDAVRAFFLFFSASSFLARRTMMILFVLSLI